MSIARRQGAYLIGMMVLLSIVALVVPVSLIVALASVGLLAAPGLALVIVVDPAGGSARVGGTVGSAAATGVWVVVASMAELVVVGFVLNIVWELTRTSWLVAIWVVVLAELGVAEFRSRASDADPSSGSDGLGSVTMRATRPPRTLPAARVLAMVGLSFVMLVGAVVLAFSSSQHHEQRFAQLWLVEHSASSQTTGATAQLGVRNVQGARATFVLRVYRGSSGISVSTHTLHLADGESRSAILRVKPHQSLRATLELVSPPGRRLQVVLRRRH